MAPRKEKIEKAASDQGSSHVPLTTVPFLNIRTAGSSMILEYLSRNYANSNLNVGYYH